MYQQLHPLVWNPVHHPTGEPPMVSTIVTGVDGSVPAAAGARKAAELAKAFGATLHVLSAYGDFEAETLEIGSEKILLTNEQEAQQKIGRASCRERVCQYV